MIRLGKNIGGYKGETIQIGAVLEDITRAARAAHWEYEALAVADGLELQNWRRSGAAPRKRLYLSAGIHGDEPAGPLTIRQLLQENQWPDEIELSVCPCLNPTGFPLNSRENSQGLDLNRRYLHLDAPETHAHVEWLQRQPPFDLTLCLHEDWESNGFYLYEINLSNSPSLAKEILERVALVCPIDMAEVIEERPAQGGVIHPSPDPKSRPEWPEAFWLLTHKTRHSYTLEAPSDFALPTRVAALVTAVRTVLETL